MIAISKVNGLSPLWEFLKIVGVMVLKERPKKGIGDNETVNA